MPAVGFHKPIDAALTSSALLGGTRRQAGSQEGHDASLRSGMLTHSHLIGQESAHPALRAAFGGLIRRVPTLLLPRMCLAAVYLGAPRRLDSRAVALAAWVPSLGETFVFPVERMRWRAGIVRSGGV